MRQSANDLSERNLTLIFYEVPKLISIAAPVESGTSIVSNLRFFSTLRIFGCQSSPISKAQRSSPKLAPSFSRKSSHNAGNSNFCIVKSKRVGGENT